MWPRAREIINRLRGQPVREHDVIGPCQEDEMEANETTDTAPETAAADASPAPAPTTSTTPDPQGQALYQQQLETAREIGRLEAELRDAEEAYEAAIAAPVGPALEEIDRHVETLSECERRIAAVQRHLSTHIHRHILLGDALFSHRQRARGRQQETIRSQIAETEREDVELKTKVAEHLQAVAQLEAQRQALEHRARPLVQEAEKLSLRTDRLVRVNPRLAVPWQPPAGVLIKPSAWRAFVEQARANSLETAEIVVNEMTGAIVRSPLPDREPGSERRT